MNTEKLKSMIEAFSGTEAGNFLNSFPWKEIPVKEMKFSIEGIATAMYCALTDSLKVAPDRSDEVFFGSVIHELRHAAQRHDSGLMLYLLKKTFTRHKLEREARSAELSATKWAGEQRIQKWRKNNENA